MKEFINELASKEPTPGGGGASALVGTLAAALLSMVANLTSGKKKYAMYQEDVDRILIYLQEAIEELYSGIKKDEEAFAPLAKAYKIPKEDPKREEIMEKALLAAALTPLELTKKLYELVPVMEELEEKGSSLALSDVAVAAVACKAAMEGAVMNVYINTKSLKNPEIADGLNRKAMEMTQDGGKRCQAVYDRILKKLTKAEVKENF